MAKVQRANVVLDVSDDDIELYMAKGFNLLDETGKVIRKSIPNDVGELKIAYTAHIKQIAELEQKVKELTSQLKATKKKAG